MGLVPPSLPSFLGELMTRKDRPFQVKGPFVMPNRPKYVSTSILFQVLLERKRYEWEDKYKPRKPRFFNRVKTGFEWNKYNQTHYDHDNPPPKIVQGRELQICTVLQPLVLQKLVRLKCNMHLNGQLQATNSTYSTQT